MDRAAAGVGALAIRGVPIDRADRVRAVAARHSRMKLGLMTLPAPRGALDADPDHYEDVGE